MAEKHYTCKQCDAGFIASRERAFCTDKCRRRNRTLQDKPNARVIDRTPIQDCTCKGCGKIYTPKKRDRNKYCSRACAYAHMKAWAKWQGGRKESLTKKAKYCNVYFKVCVTCKKNYATRWIKKVSCSDECQRLANLERLRNIYEPIPKSDKHCESCNGAFQGHINDKFCSIKCVTRLRRNHIDRARKFGVVYEPVNALKVFDRDGWRCQICGKATPKARRGSRYTNAPELDHRVPISNGGNHTYDNVQCACRECNGSKSNINNAGQIPLFEIHNKNIMLVGGRIV